MDLVEGKWLMAAPTKKPVPKGDKFGGKKAPPFGSKEKKAPAKKG